MSGIFRSVFHGSAVITISRIVLKAFSFVSYLLTLRALSVGEYGMVALALSLSGPILALSGLGLDDLLMAQGARARGEKRFSEFLPVYSGFAMAKLIITVLVVAIAIGFLLFAPNFFNPSQLALIQRFFWPLLAWVTITNVRVLIESALQMFERFGTLARVMMFENFSRMCMVIGLFATHRITVTSVIWTYVLAKVISTAFALPILGKLRPTGWIAAGKRYLSFVMTQGKWEVLRSFFGNMFSGVDQWVVGIILGVEAVGILSFASQMNSLLSQALPFRQVLFPILSRVSGQSKTSSFVSRRIAKYSFWLNGIVMIAAFIAGPILIRFLVPQYGIAFPIFVFLSFAQLLNAMSTAHGSLFYALNEQKFLLGLSLLGTVSSLTILPALTFFLGIYGAVLERHVSSAIIIWIRERRLRKRHKIDTFRFRDLVSWDAYDRQIVARMIEATRSRLHI